ncbi:methyltransferase [Candidatus Woesearchaeota archaeon]|nr:methyltransferase [Candidatus Woesearchaeota archaeon]
MKISSKKGLAVVLSSLKSFEKPKVLLEQYPTEADIAAEVLWNAFFRREIEGKTIADLGAGTGVLGIGALLLGAKHVFFVEKDEDAIQTAKENLKIIEDRFEIKLRRKTDFLQEDVLLFDEEVDVVVQNPPFGLQKERHADRKFLVKAMEIADVIYSFHKADSVKFIKELSKDNGFNVEGFWRFEFPLKNVYVHHRKKIQHIEVGCWRLEKVN